MSILQNAAIRTHIPGDWRFKGITDAGLPIVFYSYDFGVNIFTKQSIAEYALQKGRDSHL